MSAQSDARGEAAAAPAGRANGTLAAELRAIASKAADAAGGGVALLFATADADDAAGHPLLRAAAGFPSPRAAREAANAVAHEVRAILEAGGGRALESFDGLGARAAGGLWIHALESDGRVRGALVVGSPEPLASPAKDRFPELAGMAALRLAHSRLERELAEARERIAGFEGTGQEKSEEILKLSEALFAQDIELLRSTEKLGKVEKLKNDFIEKMSRELRTPLNSIIEAIISVLAGEDDSLSETAKASLRSALNDGTAFLRTLQNILDLWRIKQGELPVEIQDVNFRETMEEAIFSVQESLEGRPVVIEPRIEEGFPKIRTDLAKLNQILFLLLDNATKFTPSGRIEIWARAQDGQLTCEVRDTGIGICPDDQQFVFDEFFQVDNAASETCRGAGLGLALVRDLIVLMDGEISIASDVGRGTAVTFRVPVQVAGEPGYRSSSASSEG